MRMDEWMSPVWWCWIKMNFEIVIVTRGWGNYISFETILSQRSVFVSLCLKARPQSLSLASLQPCASQRTSCLIINICSKELERFVLQRRIICLHSCHNRLSKCSLDPTVDCKIVLFKTLHMLFLIVAFVFLLFHPNYKFRL